MSTPSDHDTLKSSAFKPPSEISGMVLGDVCPTEIALSFSVPEIGWVGGRKR
jgi:hypothetical protein